MPAIQMNLGMPPCPSTYRGSRGKPGGAARPDMLVELETSPLHVAAVVPHLVEVSAFFDLGLGDKIDLRSLEELRAEQWQKMRARFSDAAATTSAPAAPELRVKIGGIYCSAPADAGVDPKATMVKVCLGSLVVASDPSPAQLAAAAAKRSRSDPRGGLIADLPEWSACYPAKALTKQRSDDIHIALTLMQAVVGPVEIVGALEFAEDVRVDALPYQLIHPIDLTVTMLTYQKAVNGVPASRILCALKCIRVQAGMSMLKMLLAMQVRFFISFVCIFLLLLIIYSFVCLSACSKA